MIRGEATRRPAGDAQATWRRITSRHREHLEIAYLKATRGGMDRDGVMILLDLSDPLARRINDLVAGTGLADRAPPPGVEPHAILSLPLADGLDLHRRMIGGAASPLAEAAPPDAVRLLVVAGGHVKSGVFPRPEFDDPTPGGS